MQIPILQTYELDFYDSVRLYLKEGSGIFEYLLSKQKLHNENGRIFIRGKFIKIATTEEGKSSNRPKAEKYYFIENNDISKLKNPNILELDTDSDLPEYILEINQSDIITIELLLDYSVR
ncbi:hypothetical protein [Sporocytophaga myxococcoides]|uniref:hypothetical protein n=1 Tax=Sporocytophaga myxococcoides TaxID=153721 RepID=UPI000408297E|nr:hypothetical protein [Sporocytophaga myxococcoides]